MFKGYFDTKSLVRIESDNMEAWEVALDHFIHYWKDKEEVIGILVCGSYITGNPSARSDIDIHIVISDECNWRERGNQIIKGFLVEYFINPPKQIRRYFEEDYNDRSTMSMVQFLTGQIILDRLGIIHELKKEAQDWKDKQYKQLSHSLIEIKKYGLWDELDNLLDCYEAGRNDFEFVYFNALHNLYCVYCSIFSIEEIPSYQLYKYFLDTTYLHKYLKKPFPDQHFSKLFINSLTTVTREEKVTVYRQLNEYVINKAGGFSIDGWKLRSELSIEKG